MAIRPIDGEELLGITRLLDTDVVRKSKTASWLLDQVLHDIQAMPTLTPPNEPLTLEQLREMDEPTPVWWKRAGCWCLCERGFIIAPNGNIYEFEETDGTFYRRPPEGEEDT